MTTAVTPAECSGRPARDRSDETYDVLTVLALLLGGFLVPVVGWLAGVVLLWAGPRWSTGQKWLGTLVWPAIVAVPLVLAGVGGLVDGAAAGPWFVAAAVVGTLGLLVALPIVFVRLLRARRTA